MRTLTPGNSERGVPSGKEGFTLVELLVVMVLIVLLIGMMTPSLASFHAESQLRSGLRSLVAQCQYARDLAVSRNVQVRVNWNVEERTHFVTLQQDTASSSATGGSESGKGSYFSTSLNGRDAPTETEFVLEQTELGGVQTLPSRVTFAGVLTRENTNEEPTYVTFSPDGRAQDVVILLENRRGTRRAVAIEALTGRCRIAGPEDLEKSGFKLE